MLRLGKARRASLLVAELSLHVPDSLKEGQIFLQACRDIRLGKTNHLPKSHFMDLIGQAYAFAQELLPSVRVPDDVVLPVKRGRKISIGKSFEALAILQKEDALHNLRHIHALAYDDVYALKLIRTLEVIQDIDSTVRIQPVILSNTRIPDTVVADHATELGAQIVLRRYVLLTRASILTSEIRDYFRSSDIPEGYQPVGRAQRIEGSMYGVLCLPTTLVHAQGVSIGKWSVV
jgi:hypothetical protein